MSKKVCIDAGHGGNDPGAVGQAGTKEKDVALKIALKVGAILTTHGVAVTYTRTTDKALSLTDRVNIANNAGCNLFVSIHANGAENASANGQETYCYSKNGTGYILATNIQKQMVSATGLKDRGVKVSNSFYVIRQTTMPAALVETAFVTNKDEEKLLNNGDWQQKIAVAIAKGILSTLGISYQDDVYFPESWAWAKETGICDGTYPKNYITRQQFIEILYRFANKKGLK